MRRLDSKHEVQKLESRAMAKSQVTTTYISASANRHSQAAHSSNDSLVAFGSSKFVALWNTADGTDRGVYETLHGHEGVVTCVRFAHGQDDVIYSGDDKGYLGCWEKIDSKWNSTLSLKAHSKALSALASLENCIVTGSSDATVRIWTRYGTGSNLTEVQSIDLKGKFALDIQLAHLPGSTSLAMAVAMTERQIGIWTRSEDNVFIRAASLPGHEDWVKCLAFANDISGPGISTLASGSQDGTIRLWNIERHAKMQSSSQQTNGSDDLLDKFEAALGDFAEEEEGGRQISMKRHVIAVKGEESKSIQFSITFDALLIGHEAGVTSLAWRPQRNGSDATPALLSTSTDSSLILWSPTSMPSSTGLESSSVWINQQRFGDLGGQRLGGFVGGFWSRCGEGDDAMAWGWNGSWRRWRCTVTGGRDVWNEVGAITGHNGPVRGLSWSPRGEYMITASLDQSTRIHGPVNHLTGDSTDIWHEIGRPQIHGYDLLNAVFLDALKFVSVADEKVARVFEAPRGFASLTRNLGIFTDPLNDPSERAIGATVPPLGLSNKALSETTDSQVLPTDATMLNRRPFEGELASTTLWPETEKIFGHGYELISLGVSHSNKYVATACKATTSEHAVIRVYSTTSWQLFGQPLPGHSLSVTRIAFSPDDRYILSVSRDRTWRLFEHTDGGYVPTTAEKPHARIIWDCAWACEGDIFATAARDKLVKVWQRQDPQATKWTAIATLKLKEAATAVAFSTQNESGVRHLAIGLETGEMLIYSGEVRESKVWHEVLILEKSAAHIDHVYRLAWRPHAADENRGEQLASCSEDGTVRLYSFSNLSAR
ncbi:WD40 repeat-like protein [Rickenella mellea]|uniref:Elongator complex protein 2 n=1 Tax=Rickenella mellea TaxID=50990 RepID=A0A4R5XFH2_9AGAM|nr:WD40 repeat-like protein [Rickenella mellea]